MAGAGEQLEMYTQRSSILFTSLHLLPLLNVTELTVEESSSRRAHFEALSCSQPNTEIAKRVSLCLHKAARIEEWKVKVNGTLIGAVIV